MKKIYHIIFLLLAVLGVQQRVYGQATTCGAATALALNGTCVTSAYTLTSNAGSVAYTCPTASTQSGWYTFTAPANGTVTIVVTANRNAAIATYSDVGGCTLTQVNCTDAVGNGLTETAVFAVTGSTVYKVQVAKTNGGANLTGNICASFTPANDACASAVTLTPGAAGASCTTTAGTTLGATASAFAALCGGSTADDDVWYSFVATATTHQVTVTPGTITNPAFEFYPSAGCPASTAGATCVNNFGAVATPETGTFTGLTIGTTYRVRVYSVGNATGQGTFDICVTTPSANDLCANAVTLTPAAAGAACATTAGTTLNATASAFAALCGGSTADDDVWYSFVATATTHQVTVTPGTITNPAFEFYPSAGCPAATTGATCVNNFGAVATPETGTFTGLTIGTTYRVRVYSVGNATGQGTFDICVTTPPANDLCANAVTLTPAAAGAACATTAGTTLNATASAFAALCGASTADDDVWYRFVATSTIHSVTVTPGTLSNPAFEFYSSASCPASTAGATCINTFPGAAVTESDVFTGLTIGNTYFVRVYSAGNGTGQGTFSICVTTAPVNDACSGAVTLTPSAIGGTCTNTSGTTQASTSSVFAAACGASTADDDVWYRFTATSTLHVVTLTGTGITDPAYEWYNTGVSPGACPGSTAGATCVNASAGASESSSFATVVGNTYYVRVYSVGNGTGQGTFDICVTTPPPNDICTNAVNLTVAGAGVACSATAGTTNGATQSLAATCAASTADDDVWYTFTATATSHTVTVAPSTMTDVAFELSTGGTCAAPTGVTCVNLSTGTGIESQIFTGLTIGNVYRVRVYSVGNGTGQGNFTICVATPPANDACASIVTLVPNAAGTACSAPTNGTTIGASQSLLANCASATADDDVWYQFTATATSHVVVVTPGTLSDPAFELYTGGSCAAPTGATCTNASAGASTTETGTFTGLTIGNVYRVRVYSTGAATGSGTFTICVLTPPANNDCSGAISLISAGTCSTTSGGTVAATQSQVACSGTADDDVWYSFVAEVSTHTVTVTPAVASGISDVVFEVFGGTCGSLTSLNCVNATSGTSAETVSLTGLLAGATYFVRVHSQANGSGQGAFTICVTHPTPPNDNCVNAIPLTLGAFCTTGTIVAATNTAPNGTGACGSGNRTVWYSFTAIASSQVVFVDNFSVADLNFEVYSGTCGGSLTSLFCVNTTAAGGDERQVVTGLTPGTTYLVRVNGNGATDIGDFCIQAYSVIPPNDNCTAATPLTINATCTNGSIDNATNTGTNGAVCGTDTRTVWYSFVATQTTHFINLKQEDGGNIEFTVFSGTCGGVLTLVQCTDTGGAGAGEAASVTGLTIGQTYLVRVGNSGAGDIGNFCIKVHSTPPNDLCTAAINLTVNAVCTSGHSFLATNTGTNPVSSCLTEDITVWYTFTATSTSHIIELDPETGTGDLGITLYNSSDQTCSGAFTELFCADVGGTGGLSGRETISATGLIVGRQYFVMVSGFTATDQAAFCIRVKSPPTNDACANAINLTPGAACVEGTTHTATDDAGIGNATCINEDNSVWYTFTATQTTHTVSVTNGDPSVSSGRNIGFAVYTGGCAGLTEILCQNANGNGLNERATFATTIGTTYRIMVDISNGTGNFCIAVLNPPVNDLICNAENLTLNFSCASGNLLGATNTGDPAITCGNNTRTVWYKFTATATSHNFSVSNNSTGANTDIVMQIFSSSNNTCSGVLASLGCIDAQTDGQGEETTLTGLTIGNTYFIAVAGDAANDIATFCISASFANDICSNAVPLATNASCVSGGNTGAGTTPATDGSCQTPERTVWYTFIATSSTATVNVTPSGDFDAEVTVFSASSSCSGFTQIGCQDGGGNGFREVVNLSALTVGATYYVMVDGEASDQGNFCINVTVPIVCGTNPLPSDDCLGAPLISNINGYCGVTNYDYTRDLYNNLRDIMCTSGGTEIENNGFIKFVAASTTALIELQIVNSSPTGGPPCDSGIQMNIFEVTGTDCRTAIWKPVTECVSPSGGAGSVVSVTATNLIPGNTYYIMFDGVSGDECGFLMRTPQGGGVLLPVVLTKFTGVKMVNYNHLQWTTSDEAGSSHFIVEKSTDGLNFKQVMAVAAKGNSNKIVNYEAKDTQLLPSTTYYRLKIVDLDGTITYSKIITIEGSNNISSTTGLHLYPNPAEQTINYQIIASESSDYLLEIFNVIGYKMVSKKISLKEGQNELKENLSSLSSGVYVIKVVGNDGNVMQGKFVKQ